MNRTLAERSVGPAIVRLVQGDITEEPVDAIVNAANPHLQLGGGVAGAIARKGGPSIQRECDNIGFTPVGSAAVTGAGDLPCRYVIHAVGPVWGTGDEDAKLAGAVVSSFRIATERDLKSLSLPAISSGIFGFPKDRCAHVILDSIQSYLLENSDISLEEVRICVFDEHTVQAFQAEWQSQAGGAA